MADRLEMLNDLCAKLPYGVKVHYKGEFGEEPNPMPLNSYNGVMVNCHYEIEGIKPYLRPMSSMTENERKELSSKYVWKIDGCGQIQIRYHSEGTWDDDTDCPTEEYLELFDWLNAHLFDYRGLIGKGLALEAPEGMYRIKNK